MRKILFILAVLGVVALFLCCTVLFLLHFYLHLISMLAITFLYTNYIVLNRYFIKQKDSSGYTKTNNYVRDFKLD